MLVVLSGYSDFSYVSEAVRSQAVDYLLKPLTEEALAKLLAQLKERYLAREHEQIRRKLAERINKATPPRGGENAADEQLGAFLLCAGALPICESTDMCPGAEFWSGGALREAANETINELSTFTWEFMGNTPAERIVILRADLGELPQIAALCTTRWYRARTCPFPAPATMSRSPLRRSTARSGRCARNWSGAGASARACSWRSLTTRGGRAATRRPCRRPRTPWAATRKRLRACSSALRRKNGRRASFTASFPWHHEFCDSTPSDFARAQRLRAALGPDSISSALTMDELRGDLASLCASGEESSSETPRWPSASSSICARTTPNTYQPDAGRRIWLCAQLCEHALPARIRRVALGIPHRHPHRAGQAQLLENPNALIRDVALDVGFKSQHHFSRTFKNHEGVWPSDFVHERRPG